MEKTEGGKVENDKHYYAQYELIWNLIQHYHTRWIDYFKVFLTFNSILLPAISVLFVYSIKNKSEILLFLIITISLISIIVNYISLGLMKRTGLDFKLRFDQLDRLENILKFSDIRPSLEGKEFFYDKKHALNSKTKKILLPKLGIPVKLAFTVISISIICYYLILIGISIWSLCQENIDKIFKVMF